MQIHQLRVVMNIGKIKTKRQARWNIEWWHRDMVQGDKAKFNLGIEKLIWSVVARLCHLRQVARLRHKPDFGFVV